MRNYPVITALLGQTYKPLTALYKATFLAVLLAGAAGAAEKRVVAFGDSLTAGFGLPEEAGFVPQLEAWLQGQGADVVVINAGVSGDTTAGGLSRVGWVLAEGADLEEGGVAGVVAQGPAHRGAGPAGG